MATIGDARTWLRQREKEIKASAEVAIAMIRRDLDAQLKANAAQQAEVKAQMAKES